ncbi:Maf family protein [Syntrophotalea acetylenica]|jgi:septum formation protein|uniref:Maf family protein n=1 Tax=Syntrophotalea acetylenica TaxID=29542 RepID=UPI002A36686C|nr:Maf family protein [Syntrophotalea acetylenica]MDY0261049.1 Maf family protein [Syntrophotalea acetylenica]
MNPDPRLTSDRLENTIVLASASPRRSQLLASAGIAFTVVGSDAPETIQPGESPQQHVRRLSLLKAREVAHRSHITGRWFIGSDTVVVRDAAILGKPADAGEAAAMLGSLSGRSHNVITGFAIIDRIGRTETVETVSTRVWFRELTDLEIQGYIATGEPFGKAGAYAIQGIGACMIPAIEGSYTNVVGLPLCEVVATLEKLGAIRLFASGAPRSDHLDPPS